MKFTTNLSNIKVSFNLKNSTNIAGLLPFLQFLKQMEIEGTFRCFDSIKKGNSKFPFRKIIVYLIIGWMASCSRLFHFRSLQKDALVQQFMGGRCPHHTLLGKDLRYLAKFNVQPDIKELMHDIIEPALPSSLILDFDSTIETVYGHQEMAKTGPNPHKPGRKSYHPLLVYEGKTRLCLNAALRPGNRHTADNAIDLAEETLNLLSESQTVSYARFDKGFAGEDFYGYWEGKQIDYAGKLKWTGRLAKTVYTDPEPWIRFVDEDIVIEGKTIDYQATSWDKSRRVSVIRKAARFEMDQVQLIDFIWEHEAIVHTMDWSPMDIWRFYNQRACMENYIKEAKHGFSINRIPTGSFKANELDLLIKLFAYNLFELFKMDHCPAPMKSYTIQRFRREIVQAAGVFVYHARQIMLKIQEGYLHKRAFTNMVQSIQQLE
ncbi:IS1380 family transposase [Siminovitchia fortis]|uniref:IS1380 family transposase n=2 Tax=Bacillales TaxID=1385 RepID=UPI00119CA615|nr:IS1380 family transposase [Siminovitchia fortis]WHY80343.1 IS1380 family transposase [Siminovitchia fortis]WHY80352.1 IS1380 family transposase [Siminovitchia fortis]WHY80470.1 IS1380 family transposase [Siminovitchia fortis]WHY80510.1 IS1380 family transposase [Siminovitchia fortis]WHY80552.1 IS1380 family transposase [Siminovitchia fortis]